MKWFLTIAAFVTLCASMVGGLFGYLTVTWVGFGGFVAMLIAANLDRISQFKASSKGIEARTREVIAKAETTVTELQLLARIVGEITLSLVKRNGRLGGYKDDEAESIKQSVLNLLRKVGVTESEFPKIMRDWHRLTEFDYSYYILEGHYLPSNTTQEIVREWYALRTGINNIPDPGTIRAFLQKHQCLTEEAEGYLLDYEYYRKNRSHRRPEIWKDREHWGKSKRAN